MKRFVFGLMAIILTSFAAFGATIPYSPELEARLAPLPFVAKATLDIASNPTFGSSTVDSGAHGLGVYIPEGSIIIRSWLDISTVFDDSGSGTLALHCEDANNILSAEDVDGDAAGFKAGSTPTGAIANACQITATVAGTDLTAGKANIYVEYIRR